ncbi:hypothetical protein H0E87_012109 [Populus deltoides]|uniref:SAUR family protein n=1 Tax=Populus deltoides TaxID=3696 RepID=A0A8T2YI29_POPDE|nr:hypothetical protein H0E87_012109 [Populus deltoides]
MLGKKIVSFKKLAKKVKEISRNECKQSQHECLLRDHNFDDGVTTPTGFFAIYVGEDRERNRLVVPCNVSTFQEVLNAVECCNGRFDFGNLVEEFL